MVRSTMRRWLFLSLTLVCFTCVHPALGAAPAQRHVTILVHGIVVDLAQPSEVWGRFESKGDKPHWTGTIGYLETAGYRFGGVVQPGSEALDLPNHLATVGVCGNPKKADFFVVQFSENAATDGIALKTMELAAAIAKVREFTGCQKVRLVAHSAGGLVARAYLQSAFPDVLKFRNDVDRLITVGTPHLGSAVAEYWGDWLGTRATSLATTASLVRDLNEKLELPSNVYFSSIVVRGIWKDVDGEGHKYDPLVDGDFEKALPVDFRIGGDQVLNVRTQNLRMVRCGSRYEKSTGAAVQYVVARIRQESNELIHIASLESPEVQAWIRTFLENDGSCWKGFAEPADRKVWINRQANSCAFGMLEQQVCSEHWISGVHGGSFEVAPLGDKKTDCYYRFTGEGYWKGSLVGLRRGSTPVQGTFRLSSDEFGRVRGLERLIGEAAESPADGADKAAAWRVVY